MPTAPAFLAELKSILEAMAKSEDFTFGMSTSVSHTLRQLVSYKVKDKK